MSLDISLSRMQPSEIWSYNVTHNLGPMAEAAGVYRCMWRPEEIGIVYAHQMIDPLRAGLEMLERDRDRMIALNPSNGWGSYDGLVRAAREYLAACVANPDATVGVDR